MLDTHGFTLMQPLTWSADYQARVFVEKRAVEPRLSEGEMRESTDPERNDESRCNCHCPNCLTLAIHSTKEWCVLCVSS